MGYLFCMHAHKSTDTIGNSVVQLLSYGHSQRIFLDSKSGVHTLTTTLRFPPKALNLMTSIRQALTYGSLYFMHDKTTDMIHTLRNDVMKENNLWLESESTATSHLHPRALLTHMLCTGVQTLSGDLQGPKASLSKPVHGDIDPQILHTALSQLDSVSSTVHPRQALKGWPKQRHHCVTHGSGEQTSDIAPVGWQCHCQVIE